MPRSLEKVRPNIFGGPVDSEYGRRFAVSDDWQQIKAAWAAVKSAGLKQTPEQSDAAHGALDQQLDRMVEQISAGSHAAPDGPYPTAAH